MNIGMIRIFLSANIDRKQFLNLLNGSILLFFKIHVC